MSMSLRHNARSNIHRAKKIKDRSTTWLFTGLICGVILILITVIAASGVLLDRKDKVLVNVLFAPFRAEVTFNGERVENNAKNYLKPGNYEVKVVLSEFETLIKTVTISGEEDVFGVLSPVTERGTMLAKEYASDYLKVESLSNNKALAESVAEQTKYPLLSRLPVNLATYSLSYRYAEDGHLQIVVRADETYLEVALSRLKELAQDSKTNLVEYDIVIEGTKNPFLEPVLLSDYHNTADFVLDSFPNSSFALSDWQRSGAYYYATMTTGSEKTYNLVTYRVILRWDGTRLEFAALPQPVLTIYNAQNIPVELLDIVNKS